MIESSPFDIASHFENINDVQEFLEEAEQTCTGDELKHAQEIAAKAKNKMAREAFIKTGSYDL